MSHNYDGEPDDYFLDDEPLRVKPAWLDDEDRSPLVFLAHARHDEEALIYELAGVVYTCLAPHLGTDLGVVSARHDFLTRAEGNWRGWGEDVATSDRFVAIAVPVGPVGKATAEILEQALRADKAVLGILPDGLCEVSGLADAPAEWNARKKTRERSWKHYADVLPGKKL